MSEESVLVAVSVPPEYRRIVDIIQKFGCAAIEAYRKHDFEGVVSACVALQAFSLPEPCALSIELIEILFAEDPKKLKILAENFVETVRRLVLLYNNRSGEESKERIPEAIGLQMLALALAEKLGEAERTNVVHRLDSISRSFYFARPDVMLLVYPSKKALKAKGLSIPGVYSPLERWEGSGVQEKGLKQELKEESHYSDLHRSIQHFQNPSISQIWLPTLEKQIGASIRGILEEDGPLKLESLEDSDWVFLCSAFIPKSAATAAELALLFAELQISQYGSVLRNRCESLFDKEKKVREQRYDSAQQADNKAANPTTVLDWIYFAGKTLGFGGMVLSIALMLALPGPAFSLDLLFGSVGIFGGIIILAFCLPTLDPFKFYAEHAKTSFSLSSAEEGLNDCKTYRKTYSTGFACLSGKDQIVRVEETGAESETGYFKAVYADPNASKSYRNAMTNQSGPMNQQQEVGQLGNAPK